LNINKKYLRYQYIVTQVNQSVIVHLRNSSKQADFGKMLG